MTIATILVLLVIGFVLIGIEIFVTPGFVVGLVGLLFLCGGIFLAYTSYSTHWQGHMTLTFTAFLLIGGIFAAFKSGFWKRISLTDNISARAFEELDVKEGMEGVTLSALRPSGTALIENKKYEVYSEDGSIDVNTLVVVANVNANKILVKSKNV